MDNNKIPKVLLITNIPASYRVDFYNLLATTDKIDCYFLFVPDKGTTHKKIIWGNTNNYFYKKSIFVEEKNILIRYKKIVKQILRIKPKSIVIGGLPDYYPVLFFLKLFLNLKIFCWWGGHKWTEHENLFKRLYRKLSAVTINGCFFYSDYAATYFLNHIKKVDFSNYRVVGNNTRILYKSLMNNKIIRDFIIHDSKGRIKIITVGFQEKRKNTIILLKSLKLLNDKNVLVEIIGDGHELNTLIKFKEANQLFNVSFTGNLSPHEVMFKIRQADILIHPSISDSWPQVINEAAVCGVPYLVSKRAGVINEYTKKYGDIVLFNPKNEIELVKNIQYLIYHPLLLSELGEYAKKDALENNGKKVFANFIELLVQ